ncbi:MAG: hypothetical protein ACLQVX_18495 [Limisphaerales bacterium]
MATLIAAIAAAIVGVAQAQTPLSTVVPAGLPARLSIGSMPEFLDGIATNQASLNGQGNWVCTILTFQDTNGQWSDRYQTDQVRTRYVSYNDYKSHVVSDVLALQRKVSADPTYNGSNVWVFTGFSVDDITSLDMHGNVGLASEITSNAVEALQPDYCALVVPVTNLVKLEIRVPDSSPPYSFVWSNGVATTSPSPSPFPAEYTENYCVNNGTLNLGTNHVLLNQWYSMGTNATRITMSTAKGQVTYTGLGDPIAPPVVRMLDRSHLHVASARGANTTVESSPELNGPWSVFTTLVNQTNDVIVEIPATGPPRQFFRAFSN